MASPVSPAPLVGRARELARLREALDAAQAGSGSLLLITGEVGIGKTALAEQLGRDGLAAGAQFVIGRSFELPEPSPYGPWRELIAQLASVAPALVAERTLPRPFGDAVAQNTYQLQRAIVGVLLAVARSQPLVVLLDDLHWADPASIELLRALAAALPTAPLLVVGTYRASEEGAALRRALAHLTPESGVLRLSLARLSASETAAIIAAHYPVSRHVAEEFDHALYAQTDGNPFFLLESLRDIAARVTARPAALVDPAALSLPDTIREALEARLRRLSAQTQCWLEVGAILGEDFTVPLAGAVLRLSEQTRDICIAEARAAQILADDGGEQRSRFTHPLIPRVLIERQPPYQQRDWHNDIAAILGHWRDRGEGDWTAQLAYHLRAAGKAAAATPYYLEAARRATIVHAELAATTYYRAALAGLPLQALTDRAQILLDCGWTLRHIDGPEACFTLEEALEVASRAGHVGLIGRAQARLGLLRCFAGDFARGLPLARRGAEALSLGTSDEQAESAGNWHSLGMWYGVVGRYQEAIAAVERSTVIHAALPAALVPHWANPLARLENLLNLPWAMLGRPAASRAASARRRAVYYADHDLKMVAATIEDEIRSVLIPYYLDQGHEIEALLAEREQANAIARADIGTFEPPRAACQVRLLWGSWDEAERLLNDAAQWADPLAVHTQVRATMRAELFLARGEYDAVIAALRCVLPAGAETVPGLGDHLAQLTALLLGAACARACGDLDKARAFLDTYDRWRLWSGAVFGQGAGTLARAELARAAGDRAALALAVRACVEATAQGDRLTECRALRLRGELDLEETASTALTASLTLAGRCRLPYEEALTRLALARYHWRVDRAREAALAEVGAARATFARLRAAPALAAAAALLAELAAPDLTVVAGSGGLTVREIDVLRLVAEGLPNRAIGARLAVSPRTVSTHLEHISTLIASCRSWAVPWTIGLLDDAIAHGRAAHERRFHCNGVCGA